MPDRSARRFPVPSLFRGFVLAALCSTAVLMAPGAAHAQTIYHNPPDIDLLADQREHFSQASIDLDGDGNREFLAFTMAYFEENPIFPFIQLQGLGATQVVTDGIGPIGGPLGAALAAGTTIGPASNFSETTAVTLHQVWWESFGHWSNLEEHYIGLKFFTGAQAHYGWVRAMAGADSNDASHYARLVIKDWAYNSTPGEAIIAGDTGASAVPEPSSLALFAAGSTATLALLRRRRSLS